MLSLAHPAPPIPMGRARTALRAPAPGWGSYCSVITLPSLPRPPASRPAPSIRALIQSGEGPELRRVAPLRHVALKPEYRLPHGDRAIQGCFCPARGFVPSRRGSKELPDQLQCSPRLSTSGERVTIS